jgi:hypothetical protein
VIATFLDRLGGLVSRLFVVGYFVPVLVFGVLNAVLLGWQVEAFREWAPGQFEGLKGLYAVPVLIGLAVLAYLIFSVNVFLRQTLEGRRLLPDRAKKMLERCERARYALMETTYRTASDEFYGVQEAKAAWWTRLTQASDTGHAKPRTDATYDQNSAAAGRVRALRHDRALAKPISKVELEAAVEDLCGVLAVIDRGAAHPAAGRLARDYDELLEILDDAAQAWDARRIAALHQLEMQFGLGQPRPTRMGNVAAALESYAQTRYRMNLDTVWNRMQPLLQGDEKFYGQLVESKSQLDFLVVSCWLSMLTGAAWLVAMPWLRFSWPFFLVVGLLPPLLARAFYQLAVENYLVFADVVKSSVDLFRFQLLQSLRVPLPSGVRQERALWASLQDLQTYGKEGLEISYQHDRP